jgi:uncharacterized protein
VLWNDQGMLLTLRAKDIEAEESFRTAIALAPTYAEPFAHLAALRAKQGGLPNAISLMKHAVQHAPGNVQYAERLEAYRALVDCQRKPDQELLQGLMPVTAPITPHLPGEGSWTSNAASLDWNDLGMELTQEGCIRIPGLVDAATCAVLRLLFDDDTRFAKTVIMDRDEFGQGVYRYFKAPIPAMVDALRRGVYPHVARIANKWQDLLNETERFPETWEDFRLRCQEAGQTIPTPILLKYGPGGFNALHRDLRGSVYFPLQMAVVLSSILEAPGSEAEAFRGGEFLFCDVPESKKSRRRVLAAGLGDALVFCTRDRLVRVGGAYGLQPVKHGVNRITEGSRLVLGVPFHEYR